MAVLFVDSGDGLCIGLHITLSLQNDDNGVFVGVCVCMCVCVYMTQKSFLSVVQKWNDSQGSI